MRVRRRMSERKGNDATSAPKSRDNDNARIGG